MTTTCEWELMAVHMEGERAVLDLRSASGVSDETTLVTLVIGMTDHGERRRFVSTLQRWQRDPHLVSVSYRDLSPRGVLVVQAATERMVVAIDSPPHML